jgi:hypothetical protein
MERNSSYIKVYIALTETVTWKALVDDITDSLTNATVDEINFECETKGEGTDAKSIVYPVFRIKYAKMGGEYPWKHNPPSLDETRWNISSIKLWPPERIKAVVDNEFGTHKAVKTRNCKYEMIINGKYRKSLSSFHEHSCTILEAKFKDLKAATLERLKSDCLRVMRSPEFTKSKEEATIKFCKDTICNTMMRWRHMPDSILREALDQFVATTVMVD